MHPISKTRLQFASANFIWYSEFLIHTSLLHQIISELSGHFYLKILENAKQQ